MNAHQSKLGVDTGGTFTDFVWIDGDGRLHIHKQRSTPHDPSESILGGIETLAIPDSVPIVHGSTVATNALLERRGAKAGLITTRGFRDVLAIGRQNRPDLYALVPRKPDPLIPQAWRFEVTERVTAEGEILTPLNRNDLRPLIDNIAAEGIESVAVCLLFSFLRPEHEQTIKAALLKALPQLHLSLSSEILPEYREYERTATTVINAYVAPLMSRYLTRLAHKVGQRPLAIMQSNGGLISANTAGDEAARTVLSGPAGGVVGAQYIAEQAGYPNIITFDMGGTSTDVALCPARLPTTSTGSIADLPLRLPIIDIHTVGAGGGSLGYVDAGGALHVGPESAGADPGPACYPHTGTNRQNPVDSDAAVTDANLILGRLDADHFLGGSMTLDIGAAQAALETLAGKMGMPSAAGAPSAEAAAWGVIQVANAHMERAIRKISVERGYDPRDFTLVPFGGAGPLHACDLARSLQIPHVLVPPTPGVLSALGMLVAAPTKDYSRTVMLPADGDPAQLAAEFDPLQNKALAEMLAEGHAAGDIALQRSLDMRYVGQSHELTAAHDPDTQTSIADSFHSTHATRYGYSQPDAPVEVVTIRLSAVASTTPPPLPQFPTGPSDAGEAIVGQKRVWFEREPQPTTLYARDRLRPGHQFSGPAVVFQYDTTLVVPPTWHAAVDTFGNLLLTHNA